MSEKISLDSSEHANYIFQPVPSWFIIAAYLLNLIYLSKNARNLALA